MTIRSISINKDLEKKTVNHCNNTGRTVSGLISFLLRKYLDEVKNEIDFKKLEIKGLATSRKTITTEGTIIERTN